MWLCAAVLFLLFVVRFALAERKNERQISEVQAVVQALLLPTLVGVHPIVLRKDLPMPILDIEIVLRPDQRITGNLAAEIAERAGAIFGSAPQQTWVKLRLLAREQYAENGAGPPEGVYPVFVSVLKAHMPAPELLQAEVAVLAEEIAAACARPIEQIHPHCVSSLCSRARGVWRSAGSRLKLW
jgi:hypothetical protein